MAGEAGRPAAGTVEDRVFRGGSEMARRMRAFDWAATPLGPVEAWPASLRTAVGICLTSRYPIVIWWGPERTQLYNDGYRAVMGAKHPRALGRPAHECWSEIWHIVGPMMDGVLATGEATWSEDLLLVLERYGYREEAYFTFSYSPLVGDAGAIDGIFCAVTETTGHVINARRLRTLSELGAASLVETRSAEEACELAGRTLATSDPDVPFAAVYLADGDGMRSRLACTVGVRNGDPGFPDAVDLRTPSDARGWPIASVQRTGRAQLIDDLPARFGPLPGGRWPDSPRIALVLPIAAPGSDARAGVLVAGVSPRRALDAEYGSFFGLVAGHVGTAIANARAYEAERARAEALAELDRAKTAFFSNVSHEFRTPLTLMLGPLEDALADLAAPLPPAQRERVDVAHRNSLRLAKLVNTLLDFSRIESGRVEAVYEPTDIAHYTAELASSFRSATERAGLRLLVRCPPLPAPAYVDREMWEKVVLNLLSNAFKFTFEGEIAVELHATGDAFELRVRDTGTGIPTAELPHLFERFHRVHGARGRTQEGSGIGLALVQELVRLHGGTVGVESAVGAGTTFTVRIPGGKAHLPAARIGAPRTLASTALGTSPYVEEALRWLPDAPSPEPPTVLAVPGAHIVVADDNADMRDYLVRLLSPYWSVEAMPDGQRALAAAQARVPDLVLTDVMMPGLDGFALLRALRSDARTAAVPVILLSARAGEESRVEGLHAGADDYLVKPFAARELLARVSAHLGLARLRQATARQERELRQELQALLDGAPVGIWVAHDAGCRRVTRNEYAAQLLGQPEVRVVGTAPDATPLHVVRDTGGDVIAPEETPLRLAAGGVPVRGAELVLERPDGRVVHLVGDAVPLLTEDGVPRGAIAVMTDVTALKAGEAEREQLLVRERQARADAEAANRAKDDFLAVLSHELRSPLQGILGWARVLRAGDASPEQTQHALGAIERIVRQQTQLVNDLLDVSRIVAGRLALERTPVDFATVVREAAQESMLAASERGVAVEVHVDDGAALVRGDAARLRQVVDNLLSNAVKFTPAGGRIDVRCRRDDDAVLLEVADTGKGIAPAFLPRLFDRFTQADAASTRHEGGLGLGLAIVRHLCEQHGGTVSARSDGPGGGATFTVRLPALRDAVALDRVPAPVLAPANGAGDGGLRGLSVLLVEDDDESRTALSVLLEHEGASVIGARSAAEAFRVFETAPPDAVISDLGMPGEDGYSLIRRVRRAERGNRSVPALALTGFASGRERERALEAGFDAHLAKPFDPEELVRILGRLAREER